MIKPHEVYSRLGGTASKRQEAYRALFHGQVNKEFIETLPISTHKGMVIGSERFKEQLEALSGRKMDNLSMGRPKKLKK